MGCQTAGRAGVEGGKQSGFSSHVLTFIVLVFVTYDSSYVKGKKY